jgi:ABC-type transport system substrate-binding protein
LSPAARAARAVAPPALVLILLAALPGPARTALGPRYGGSVVVGVPEMPASIEPAPVAGATSLLLGGLVHETLVGIDAEGLPVPALVEGWAAAADGREWRLALRETATFHDGRPVASAEALAAVRRFLRSASPAAAWLAAGLDGGTAFRSGTTPELPGAALSDARHLVLRFVEPRTLPLAPLAAPAAAVTGARGAGCGPFLPLTPAPGTKIRVTAFGGHVRGRPFLDAVDVVAVPRPQALEAEFRAGAVDVLPSSDGGVSSLSSVLMLMLDPARPPFDRPGARAAVAAAIDRADIVKRLMPGADAAAALLAPGLLPPLADRARVAKGPVAGTIRMAVGADVPALVSQRIVASLGAVGLHVEARAVRPTEARTAAAAARLFLWSPEVAEAGLALHELMSLAPGATAAEEAVAAAARERDLDRRRALLHRAEAALRAENRLVPVASAPVSFRARAGVHDVRVDLSGRLVLEDAWREP